MTNPKPPKSKTTPTRVELANFRVLDDLGLSGHAIARLAGRDGKTVRKWLKSDVYQEDPKVHELVTLIREKETDDLLLLGAKARARLHELIPKETKIIPLVATVDRCFQQLRLLQGKSTNNAAHFGSFYLKAEQLKPDYSDDPLTIDATPESKRA